MSFYSDFFVVLQLQEAFCHGHLIRDKDHSLQIILGFNFSSFTALVTYLVNVKLKSCN